MGLIATPIAVIGLFAFIAAFLAVRNVFWRLQHTVSDYACFSLACIVSLGLGFYFMWFLIEPTIAGFIRGSVPSGIVGIIMLADFLIATIVVVMCARRAWRGKINTKTVYGDSGRELNILRKFALFACVGCVLMAIIWPMTIVLLISIIYIVATERSLH